MKRYIIDGTADHPYQIFDNEKKGYIAGPYRFRIVAAAVCGLMNWRDR